jgi:hypothetical protein
MTAFEIEQRWKEEVIYWEGPRGYFLAAGWGGTPPVLAVPTAALWDQVVPPWLRGRRDEVLARLREHSGHVLEETEQGFTGPGAEGRELSR